MEKMVEVGRATPEQYRVAIPGGGRCTEAG